MDRETRAAGSPREPAFEGSRDALVILAGNADMVTAEESQLVLGRNGTARTLNDVASLLVRYHTDDGLRYLDYEPASDPNHLVPDDLAATILINSRVGPAAFKSVQDRGAKLALTPLPDLPLEETTASERRQVAELIAQMASWPGLAASVATKVLHKKRPTLIPILDNQAIFGAYMNPSWPAQRSSADSIYAVARIADAIESIAYDLTRVENRDAWRALAEIEERRSRIELFDMVWWMYFRDIEPVGGRAPI
jgi:hypothetical protein